MKTQTYKYVLALLTVALMGTSYALLNNQMHVGAVTGGSPQDVGYTGMVCHTVTRADGTEEDYGCNHNLLFPNGKNITTSQLFSTPWAASATAWVVNNISVGNGTVAPSQTSTIANFGGIADCGLAPHTGLTWISVPNATSGYIDASGNVSANYKWTATCGSGTGLEVNQTAIGNSSIVGASTAPPWLAANTFTNVFLQANDQLNVTWYVWIT